jgi:hypothetical protein
MTRKYRRTIAVCGLLMFLCIGLCAYFLYRPVVKLHPGIMIDASEVLPHLLDGDIICRLGDRVWSSFVRQLSPADKRFSHVGIVRIRDGNVSVINAECLVSGRSESVNEVTRPVFLEVARAVGVYRANFMEGSVISDNAVKYLGRPFDWKFNHEDDSAIYCTELVHLIIKQNAPEHSLRTVRLSGFGGLVIIPLEAISESDDFDEVFYISRN